MGRISRKIIVSLAIALVVMAVVTGSAYAGSWSNSSSKNKNHRNLMDMKPFLRPDNKKQPLSSVDMRHDRECRHLRTFMNGAKEVPGPGDPNGFGVARIGLHPSTSELCVKINVDNIAPATAAHIHLGEKDEAGPIVVTLPTPDANGHAEGCMHVDSQILEDIADDLDEYYVNVHNAPYPSGAVRGQL